MIPNSEYDVINNVPFTKFKGINDVKLYLVNTKAEWDIFYDLLMQQKLVACDTESSGFRYYAGHNIVGMSFGWKDMHFYVPVRHLPSVLDPTIYPQLNMEDIKADLQKFFSRQDVTTIWHNSKFDFHMYRVDGIEVTTPFHDTTFLWQFYDENAPVALKDIMSGWTYKETGIKQDGLIGPEASVKEKEVDKWRGAEARARRAHYRSLLIDLAVELSKKLEHQDKNKRELKQWAIENIVDKDSSYSFYKDAAKEDVHYGYIPIPLMTEYAALDTYLTWFLYDFIIKNMSFDEKLIALYENEKKLSRALLDAECHGVRIDRKYLTELGASLDKEAAEIESKIKLVLGDINLNSPTQLGPALIKHGCELTKKTEVGNFSTDSKVLKKFKYSHPVVDDMLQLRKINKLKDTYVMGILDKLTDEDIIHCSFNQNVSTGRMSALDPNLNNIPNKDDRIRRAFINLGPDYVYVLADYSQVEVRLTAHYSRDPLLLDAYAKNQDVHTRTMCEMFGFDYDLATKILKDETHPDFKKIDSLRTVSKRIVFGTVYGVGAPGLSEQIPRPDQYKSLDEKEWIKVCQNYLDNFFRRYIGVKRFINASNREIVEKGTIYNSFGRPRHLPHAKNKEWKEKWMVGRAKRQGTNFRIQGDAADLFKTAIVRVYELFAKEAPKSLLVNFVHDELQMYIHKDELFILNKVKQVMEDFDYIIPIKVDISYSTKSWADKRKIG